MNSTTATQLNTRTDQILLAIQTGTVPAYSDAVVELAELTVALEEASVKPVVVARLTITRAVGNQTIIEVREGASFNAFFWIYTQTGRRRSTKRLVRTANRNEGLKPYMTHAMKPGLEVLAGHWQSVRHVTSVKLRIIKKRAYENLLVESPDQLGLTHTRVNLPLRSFSAFTRPS